MRDPRPGVRHRPSPRLAPGAILGILILAAPGLLLPAPGMAQTAAADPQAAARKGAELYEQEQYAAALAEFDKALAGGARDGRTLYKAAFCQRATGKSVDEFRATMSEAVKALDAVVNGGQEKAGLQDHFYLSAAYKALGDAAAGKKLAASAVEAYRRGDFGPFEKLPADDLLRLGQMGADGGDVALQTKALGRATEILVAENSPRQQALARALADLGTAQLNQGHFQESRAALAKVMEIQPTDPGARYNYARVLFRLGDYPAAAEQWRELRHEDPARSTEAIYNLNIMSTLAQGEQLMDPSTPLEDLAGASREDLERQMGAFMEEIRQHAGKLPPEVLTRGRAGKNADEEVRKLTRTLRDRKFRLARVAAEYTARGFPIREFAFTNGMQAGIRAWRLPKGSVTDREPGPLPEWLTDEEKARYAEQQAKPRGDKGKGQTKRQAKQAKKEKPS